MGILCFPSLIALIAALLQDANAASDATGGHIRTIDLHQPPELEPTKFSFSKNELSIKNNKNNASEKVLQQSQQYKTNSTTDPISANRNDKGTLTKTNQTIYNLPPQANQTSFNQTLLNPAKNLAQAEHPFPKFIKMHTAPNDHSHAPTRWITPYTVLSTEPDQQDDDDTEADDDTEENNDDTEEADEKDEETDADSTEKSTQAENNKGQYQNNPENDQDENHDQDSDQESDDDQENKADDENDAYQNDKKPEPKEIDEEQLKSIEKLADIVAKSGETTSKMKQVLEDEMKIEIKREENADRNKELSTDKLVELMVRYTLALEKVVNDVASLHSGIDDMIGSQERLAKIKKNIEQKKKQELKKALAQEK